MGGRAQLRERLADWRVGRVARHEPERHGASGAARPGRVLVQSKLEERVAVEGLDERLDDAAHARGHPARHHAEGQLAAPEGVRAESRGARVVVPGEGASRTSPGPGASTTPRTRLRSSRSARLRGRRAPLALGAREERRGQRHEALGIEARGVEATAERRVQTSQVSSQIGFARHVRPSEETERTRARASNNGVRSQSSRRRAARGKSGAKAGRARPPRAWYRCVGEFQGLSDDRRGKAWPEAWGKHSRRPASRWPWPRSPPAASSRAASPRRPAGSRSADPRQSPCARRGPPRRRPVGVGRRVLALERHAVHVDPRPLGERAGRGELAGAAVLDPRRDLLLRAGRVVQASLKRGRRRSTAVALALALAAAIGGALGAPRSAAARDEPVLHEPIAPNPAEDLAMRVVLEGDLPAAIQTPTRARASSAPPIRCARRRPRSRLRRRRGARRVRARPDTRLPVVSEYSDPFTPSTAPFKRLEAFDAVRSDYHLEVRDARLVPLAALQGGAAPGRTRTPSTPTSSSTSAGRATSAPRRRSRRARRALEARRRRRGRAVPRPARRRRQLVCSRCDAGGAPRRVSGLRSPCGRASSWSSRFRARRSAARRATWLGGAAVRAPLPDTSPATRPSCARPSASAGRCARAKPSRSSSSTSAASSTRPSRRAARGSVYLDLALSKKGVCRHRAFAFLVTALEPGDPDAPRRQRSPRVGRDPRRQALATRRPRRSGAHAGPDGRAAPRARAVRGAGGCVPVAEGGGERGDEMIARAGAVAGAGAGASAGRGLGLGRGRGGGRGRAMGGLGVR